jgi:D-alanine-D-alanine ligase
MSRRRLHITVLCGGPSAEREISLASGNAVAAALEHRGHAVELFDPAPAHAERDASDGLSRASSAVLGHDWSGVDAVFIALHGAFGEDGEVQRLLERLRLPYTGSGPAASRLAFHKSLARRRFLAAGVPVPAGIDVSAGDPLDRLEIGAARLGYPLVVKPEAQGSSLGVSIVRSPEELPAAADLSFRYGDRALLESFVRGTEWTVPMWDDQPLPVIQIVPQSEVFDYRAKYLDESTCYRLDPPAPPEVIERIRQAGRRAAAAVGAIGLSRTDIRLSEEGTPWVLEVNTSPGMTDHSLVPKSAERYGLTLGELCEQDCRRAIARRGAHTRRRREAA